MKVKETKMLKQKNDALNEVIVLKEMRHPYIVAYRESFMNKNCLCIVMDYADGIFIVRLGIRWRFIAKSKTRKREAFS